jgi:hypothetical protein
MAARFGFSEDTVRLAAAQRPGGGGQYRLPLEMTAPA